MSKDKMSEFRVLPVGNFNNRFGEPEYTDWMDESMSWKFSCYVGDWSFLWERWFRGPDTLKLFSDCSVNSFEKFDVGQSKHVIHCNADGKVIHEGILSRLSEDDYMLFGRGSYLVDYYLRHGNYNVSSEAEDWFNIQVSGPKALALLEKASGQSMRDIKFMHSRKIIIRGKWMWALRQGMAGEVGFELQGPIKWREELIADLMEIGQEFGVRRLGARASSINHLEACFPTIMMDYIPAMFSDDMADYLAEFKANMPPAFATMKVAGSFEGESISDYYRSPIELGWANRIKLDHDFIGRAALEKELANPKRIIRTLVWNPEDVIDVYASMFKKEDHYDYIEFPRYQRGVMYTDKVLKNGRLIGATSSYGYSYYFREMLCLAVLDVEEAEIGNQVTMIWGAPGHPQKEIRATVAPAPYKTDNRKLDLHTLK